MSLSNRHSPYTIPALRRNSTPPPSTYTDPQRSSSEAACAPPQTSAASYNGLPSSSLLPSSDAFSSPAIDNRLSNSYLTDSSCNKGSDIKSPYSDSDRFPHSPQANFSVDQSSLFAYPYSTRCYQAGSYYSPASSDLSKYPSSVASTIPTSQEAPVLEQPTPVYVAAASSSTPVPGYHSPTAPLSSLKSPYSSEEYSFSNFSNSRFVPSTFTCVTPSSFSTSTLPSLSSHMPSLNMHNVMWSPYPSLPSIGPLPSTKLSYDSSRYKLTPERAIPLIKWFEEHKDHPYPTRHEKIILCQSTQLTFTQVSTWFANARRRMKKATSSEEESSSSNREADSEPARKLSRS